jgi:hypothetical protein
VRIIANRPSGQRPIFDETAGLREPPPTQPAYGVDPTIGEMALDESELRRLMATLDEALEVFNHHEKRLTARQIRLRSYLAVMRQEALEQLLESDFPSEADGYALPRTEHSGPHHRS